MAFCKEYNAKTQDKVGLVGCRSKFRYLKIGVLLSSSKTPPASVLIKKAAGIERDRASPQVNKVGSITRAQLQEIAETKMPDLNANDIEAAMKIVEGTASQHGRYHFRLNVFALTEKGSENCKPSWGRGLASFDPEER